MAPAITLDARLENDGRIVVIQEKTNHPIWIQMRPGTLEAIRKYVAGLSECPEVACPRYGDRNLVVQYVRKIIDRAGLRGAWTTLRTSSCTKVERQQPVTG